MAGTNTNELLTIIEKCRVSPSYNAVGERSLPLTYFDLVWLLQPYSVHQLFAYEFPHPKTQFLQTLIPTLKHSLSITLQHFFPFAGNLIVSKGRKPEIRHVEGDSVALTFAECRLDFKYLIGNHPRDCNKFYGLVPKLEGGVKLESDDSLKIPLFCVQVTFFPDTSGITIGITNHHSLCDASTKFDFMKAWAMITKSGTDELFLSKGVMPLYDRVIRFSNTLDKRFLNLPIDIDRYKPSMPDSQTNINKVRVTVVLTQPQINRLKRWVSTKLPTLDYVSSFTVACSYAWSCIAKSRTHILGETIKGKDDDDKLEMFVCAMDWRGRLDPPITHYFGNCVVPCVIVTKTSLLSSSSSGTNGSGFLAAVEILGKTISETLKNKSEVIKEAGTWNEKFSKGLPTIGVAGTPKLKIYNELDFGWGTPIKYEVISIDYNGSISLNANKDSPQDVEIGLSLPSKQMKAFIYIFENEIESIFSEQQ